MELAKVFSVPMAEMCYYSAILETEQDCSKEKEEDVFTWGDVEEETEPEEEGKIVRRRRCDN